MSKKLAIAMFGQKRLSREGGVEIVVKELCTRMAQNGCDVTCYNRAGHHVSGAEYDDAGKTEYEGIRQKSVPTIERRGLAAVSSSAFAALYSAFGKYDVVHIHAEGPAFFAWLPKMFGKRVVSQNPHKHPDRSLRAVWIFTSAFLFTASMVSAFIENVYVHEGGRIVVRFKYEQSIQDAVRALHTE